MFPQLKLSISVHSSGREDGEVVGRPDHRLDEVPVAFVELKTGFTANETSLIEHCRGRIANFKVPRAVYFVGPAMAMSATKIDKRALRARLA